MRSDYHLPPSTYLVKHITPFACEGGRRATRCAAGGCRLTPHPSPLTKAPSAGFTLLEVLVALAVLAIALGALVKTGAYQAETLEHLRARTFAEWVAADRLAQVRLTEPWPDTGESHGTTPMGQRSWYWTLQVSNTDEPNIRRLDVAVFTEPGAENSIVTLSGFAGRY